MDSTFEILCVTMRQNDFSKIEQMNIRSNVVFANQADRTDYAETQFNGKTAKMITTQTRGISVNRNLALAYASADICLFADDDVTYCDDYEQKIIAAFERLPDADVVVFNIKEKDSSFGRRPRQIQKLYRLRKFKRNPFGGPRIAFRLNSIRKSNVWFSMLFGCARYRNGEDSLWLRECLNKKLKIYAYPELIGYVDYGASSWFNGVGKEFYFDRGAILQVTNSAPYRALYRHYYAYATRKRSELSYQERILWMKNGGEAYRRNENYAEFVERCEKK